MFDSFTADQSPTQSATDGHAAWRIEGRFGQILWTVCIAAVVGDLVTTVYGLEIGLRERNPFVAAVLADYGVAGLVGLKLLVVAWVAIIWRLLNERYGLAAMMGLAIPQGAAVVLNVVTILTA